MSNIYRLFVISLFLFLGACASTTELTKENESKINAIGINNKVKIPEKAFYHGPGKAVGAMFGAVGAIIAEATDSNDELIVEYMKKNDINIDDIVLEEFTKQIKLNNKLAGKLTSDEIAAPDANLVLEVRIYGIAQTHGFSSEYRPTLGVAAKLVSNSGEILWEEYEFVTALNDETSGIPFEDYFKDPAVMKDKYENVSRIVVALLIKSLQ